MSMTVLYFSPNGGTRAVAERLGEALGAAELVRLTKPEDRNQDRVFAPGDTVVVAMPSYYDRLPLADEIFPRLTGNGARAVGVVTFGNNHFETARGELCDLLAGRGFEVIALAAFVTAHCLMEGVATGRPNSTDLLEIDAFAAAVTGKLLSGGAALTPPALELPPYPASPLCVAGDERCIHCDTCVGICPTDAIDHDQPMHTDPARCILCHRCAHLCPVNCRTVHAEPYHARMAELRAMLLQGDKPNDTLL